MDGRKVGTTAENATVVSTSVAAVHVWTQFPETVEDYLENRRLRVLTPRTKKKPEGLFVRLLALRREIDELRGRLLTAEAWLSYQEYLSAGQIGAWKSVRAEGREALRKAKREFWELNCPSPVERAKLQALEESKIDFEKAYKLERARIWKLFCDGGTTNPRPGSLDIHLAKPISERLRLEAKPPEERPGNKTPRAVPDPKSGPRPGKRNRPNPERRRRQKESAAGGQAAPVSVSTDAGQGEQAEKEQDSTVPGPETTPASEKTQEAVGEGQEKSGDEQQRAEEADSGKAGAAADEARGGEPVTEPAPPVTQAVTGQSGTDTETEESEVEDWEEWADEVSNLEDLPERVRRRYQKKKSKRRKSA